MRRKRSIIIPQINLIPMYVIIKGGKHKTLYIHNRSVHNGHDSFEKIEIMIFIIPISKIFHWDGNFSKAPYITCC